MSQPDIYVPYLLPGYNELFTSITAVKRQVIGYPTTIQLAPLVAHIFDGVEQSSSGQVLVRDYATIHRCYILWQDWAVAEATLAEISDQLMSAVIEYSSLGGRLNSIPNVVGGHLLDSVSVRIGFVDVANVRYRIADFRTITKVKFARLGIGA